MNFRDVWTIFSRGKQPSDVDCLIQEKVAVVIALLAINAATLEIRKTSQKTPPAVKTKNPSRISKSDTSTYLDYVIFWDVKNKNDIWKNCKKITVTWDWWEESLCCISMVLHKVGRLTQITQQKARKHNKSKSKLQIRKHQILRSITKEHNR